MVLLNVANKIRSRPYALINFKLTSSLSSGLDLCKISKRKRRQSKSAQSHVNFTNAAKIRYTESRVNRAFEAKTYDKS